MIFRDHDQQDMGPIFRLTRRLCASIAIPILILAMVGDGRSQERQGSKTLDTPLKIETRIVNLVVTVSDKKGKPVLGLVKENFCVKDNKVAQDVSFFSDADTPVSVLLLFDISGSMSGTKISRAAEALDRFYKSSHDKDEYMAMTFNEKVEVSQFRGQDHSNIISWLKSRNPTGNTALYDAMTAGVRSMRSSLHPKKVMIVISDGEDNNSITTFREVRDLLRETDILVYAIVIGGNRAGKTAHVGRARLEELSKLTGGWASFPGSTAEMDQDFDKLALELRHQYSIAYSPVDFVPDGKWRDTRVEIVGQEKMRVRTRRGYFASSVVR